MKIGIPKESFSGETRVAMIPENIAKLAQLKIEVLVEAGLGRTIHRSDAEYEKAGATLVTDRKQVFSESDVILRVRKPLVEELDPMRKGCLYISFLDPFREPELIEQMASKGISSISVEMIPRTTLAQKMDALSSQANLAGYMAVILAANHSDKIFPMMMTAAGTISPSRVFVIGAGVAGLQAIATAKRLGARVEAFDTRPVVEEQVQSLGAKFVKIDLGETGQTKDGYARQLTPEQLEKQRLGMQKICGLSDAVITTAQVFGRPAPQILNAEMVKAMQPGSVIVDLAVETGGNVEGSVLNEVSEVNGVKIVGLSNLPGLVPVHASQMYSTNLLNLITHIWDKEKANIAFDLEEEIMKGCLITHQGIVCNERLKDLKKN